MAAPVTAPANLAELVRTAFVRARAAGDLTFFPTQVALLRVRGIPFQIRFAPSLANKPKGPKPDQDGKGSKPSTPFDPFADPPPGLVVVPQLGPCHRLVLNKFAICEDHAILATTAFRPQEHLLDGNDLAAAYACITSYARSGEELFVFYNSGRHSGASQPHRHLQLLPVARMRQGLEGSDAADWGVLSDQLAHGESGAPGASGATDGHFPVFVASSRLDGSSGSSLCSPEHLHATYLDLYRQACAAAVGTSALLSGDQGQAAVSQTDEECGITPARISYNLALTRKSMAIIPRAAEGAPVAATDTAGGGALSLNGTVLAGTALVKNAAEWDALRSDPLQLLRVLGQIGVQPASPSL